MGKGTSFSVRVYFEDTDAGGIVYYANYLKFAERGRTEALYGLGLNHTQLKQKYDHMFVVRHCVLNCLAPAYLDDVLEVRTSFKKVGRAKVDISQSIIRDDKLIVTLEVVLACVNSYGRPVKIDEHIHQLLQTHGSDVEK